MRPELNRLSSWIFRSCPGVPEPVRLLAWKRTAFAPQPTLQKACSGFRNLTKPSEHHITADNSLETGQGTSGGIQSP